MAVPLFVHGFECVAWRADRPKPCFIGKYLSSFFLVALPFPNKIGEFEPSPHGWMLFNNLPRRSLSTPPSTLLWEANKPWYRQWRGGDPKTQPTRRSPTIRCEQAGYRVPHVPTAPHEHPTVGYRWGTESEQDRVQSLEWEWEWEQEWSRKQWHTEWHSCGSSSVARCWGEDKRERERRWVRSERLTILTPKSLELQNQHENQRLEH